MRVVSLFTLLSLPSLSLLACAASGDGAGLHGPSYGVDGSVDEGGAGGGGHGGGAPTDAATSSDASDASTGSHCTIAIVGGDATKLEGAISKDGKPWEVSTIAGGSAVSAPAIVAASGGFHAVVRAQGDALMDTTYTTKWSAAAAIATATARDKPAISLDGGALHLVYSAGDAKLYHGTFMGSAWDNARDPVGGAGALQDFGPGAASLATSGTSLVIAFGGNDHFLYDRTYSGSWQAAHQQPGTTVYTPASPPAPSPSMVALTGGTDDLLTVFLKQDTQPFIYWTTRNATTKTWSTPLPIDTDAATNESPSLAPMSGGRVVMMWRGTNGKAYFNTYDPTKTPAWHQHAFLVDSSTAIASPPTVATGVCGDDAIAAYPLAGGAVQVTRLKGTTWSTPESVGSLTNLGFASIATLP
jgi:hypothetical protein